MTFKAQGYKRVVCLVNTGIYKFLIGVLGKIMVTQMTQKIDAVAVHLP